VEVDQDFLQVLSGSYVGTMAVGVEIRAVQMKLWLAGILNVTVATMGGRLILLYRSTGEDVGDPVRRKDWWGGLISAIKPWSPNQVASKKELWVNIYGVPLHAWSESTFRRIVSRCGEFLAMDDYARNRSRFDVARVKVEVLLGGRIDFVIKLLIQGAGYAVHVVEDARGVAGEEVVVEDQLRGSEVGSSCASGGHGSVRAVMEDFGGVESDSDTSEGCHREVAIMSQAARQSTGYNKDFGKVAGRAVVETGSARVIPRTNCHVIETNGGRSLSLTVVVRGSERLGNGE
jgi:hypothetical protein